MARPLSSYLGESRAKTYFGCRKLLQLLSLLQVPCHLLVSLSLKLHQFACTRESLRSPERIESKRLTTMQLETVECHDADDILDMWHKEDRSPHLAESDPTRPHLSPSLSDDFSERNRSPQASVGSIPVQEVPTVASILG